MWTGRAVVVLPPSDLSLLNKPDGEIFGFTALLETIQLPYMTPDPDIHENVIHFDIVRKKFTKRDDIASLATTYREAIFGATVGTSSQTLSSPLSESFGAIYLRDRPEQMYPNKIAMGLLALNTMFVYTMGYVFTHCVLDIYGSPLPSKIEFIMDLEAE
ncbi:hypothetical protein B0O99DRAFT_689314 [Bisporella sp. PMI_857]|nr:hypothetical protein B0O99DRAFT_689314 [Bisporella sp. PMI_857]